MSIKSKTIEIVKFTTEEYKKAADQIAAINEDTMLSTVGKYKKGKNVEEAFTQSIDSAIQGYSPMMREAASAAEEREARQQAEKINNAEYQMALSAALQQIPYTIGAVSDLEMRERLSMFENDSFAIKAISKTLQSAGYPGQIDSILPIDKKGMAKEIILAVEDWTRHYVNTARTKLQTASGIVTMPRMDISRFKDEGFIFQIESYAAYLEGLSDDCTSFQFPDWEGTGLHPAATAKMFTQDFLGGIVNKYFHGTGEGET